MYGRLCIRPLALVVALHSAGMSQAQLVPLPKGVFLGFRWFEESDSDWSTRRARPDQEYRFNKGWGPLIMVSKELSPRIGITLESGIWWFHNPAHVDDANGAYEQRALTLPLFLGASATLVHRPRFNLYLQLNGGLAHTQYIHRYDSGQYRVTPRTEALYGLTVTCWFGIFRLKGTPYRTGPRLGTSFHHIGGQTLRSPYATIW